MKRHLRVFILLILCPAGAFCNSKYWVTFSDKAGCTFDPYAYFDSKAIENRFLQNISFDSTDFPINGNYKFAVSMLADTITSESRWLNGVAVVASPSQIESIRDLPFVASVEPMDAHPSLCAEKIRELFGLNEYAKKLLAYQVSRMQVNNFRKAGLDGTGIRIAVFDAGFPAVNTHPAFARLRNNKTIIATWDFVCGKEDVYSHHQHGTMTLSCIAGSADSMDIGLATGAEFLLARTERVVSEHF